MEMIYYDDWIREDAPFYSVMYMGPRCDLDFGNHILEGVYDNIMKPEVLDYYRKYFTETPPVSFEERLKKLIKGNNNGNLSKSK